MTDTYDLAKFIAYFVSDLQTNGFSYEESFELAKAYLTNPSLTDMVMTK